MWIQLYLCLEYWGESVYGVCCRHDLRCSRQRPRRSNCIVPPSILSKPCPLPSVSLLQVEIVSTDKIVSANAFAVPSPVCGERKSAQVNVVRVSTPEDH